MWMWNSGIVVYRHHSIHGGRPFSFLRMRFLQLMSRMSPAGRAYSQLRWRANMKIGMLFQSTS